MHTEPMTKQEWLRLKARSAMLRKAREGGFPGCAPVGYLNRRCGDRTWIEVDPVKAPLVQRAFDMAAEGKLSLRKIAEALAEAGLTSRNGKPLGVSALWNILTNRFYMGEIVYLGELIDGGHEPLVSRETWRKAQEQMMRRRRRT